MSLRPLDKKSGQKRETSEQDRGKLAREKEKADHRDRNRK